MSTRGWENVKESDLAMSFRPKQSKYRNVKTVIDNIAFSSKREANYWLVLKVREKAGEISGLTRQHPFDLLCPQPGSSASAVVSQYIADFVYHDKSGARHVVDAKGKRTAMYQLKKKWLELQSGIIIEEV